MMKKTTFYSLCLVVTCTIAGCVMTNKAKQWEPVQPRQKSFVHIVKWSNENLAIISSWYTGSEKNEKKLADNNPNINPKQLIIGDRIFIPKDLLIKTAPMTEEFIEQSFAKPEKIKKTESEPVTKPDKIEKTESKSVAEEPKKKKQAKEPEPVPEEEEELNLFGPK